MLNVTVPLVCIFLIMRINYEIHTIANPAENTIPCLIFYMLPSGAFIGEALAPQFTCIRGSSRGSAVEGTLFKERHSSEARRRQAFLLLENMADIDRVLTGHSSSGLSTTVCFLKKEEVSALSQRYSGILKHSILKYRHNGPEPLCS